MIGIFYFKGSEQNEKDRIPCLLCGTKIAIGDFNTHMINRHAKVNCDVCGKVFEGEFDLQAHITTQHPIFESVEEELPDLTVQNAPDVDSAPVNHPTTTARAQFLPRQFKTVIHLGDQEWVAQCIYSNKGKFKDSFTQNWFYPPEPTDPQVSSPEPLQYFRQRLFIWAPMRMFGIPLKCPKCDIKLAHGGIYRKAREVIDMDSRYYLVGECLRCSKCRQPQCPWNSDLLNQLDPSHRAIFPAVLSEKLALDRKCLTLLKPRTFGNSSSYVKKALEEIHSEEWGRQTIKYLTACKLNRRYTSKATSYQNPPPFRPLPQASWFATVHSYDIASHVDEMKAVVTSTYGRVLKIDSTKKVRISFFQSKEHNNFCKLYTSFCLIDKCIEFTFLHY